MSSKKSALPWNDRANCYVVSRQNFDYRDQWGAQAEGTRNCQEASFDGKKKPGSEGGKRGSEILSFYKKDTNEEKKLNACNPNPWTEYPLAPQYLSPELRITEGLLASNPMSAVNSFYRSVRSKINAAFLHLIKGKFWKRSWKRSKKEGFNMKNSLRG